MSQYWKDPVLNTLSLSLSLFLGHSSQNHTRSVDLFDINLHLLSFNGISKSLKVGRWLSVQAENLRTKLGGGEIDMLLS